MWQSHDIPICIRERLSRRLTLFAYSIHKTSIYRCIGMSLCILRPFDVFRSFYLFMCYFVFFIFFLFCCNVSLYAILLLCLCFLLLWFFRVFFSSLIVRQCAILHSHSTPIWMNLDIDVYVQLEFYMAVAQFFLPFFSLL